MTSEIEKKLGSLYDNALARMAPVEFDAMTLCQSEGFITSSELSYDIAGVHQRTRDDCMVAAKTLHRLAKLGVLVRSSVEIRLGLTASRGGPRTLRLSARRTPTWVLHSPWRSALERFVRSPTPNDYD